MSSILSGIAAASLPFCQILAANPEAGIPDLSERVQIKGAVTGGFIHPGIGFTKEILENARRQVLAKRDPWYSGYKALAASPNSAKDAACRNESKTMPGRPGTDAFDSRGVQNMLKQDASRAKQQALMYFFTGDEGYRANAMHIIRVWSQMDPRKYKVYSEAHIHASYPVQDLIIAAELLRYTSFQDPKLAWTEADTANFTNNFAVPAVNTFLNENGWFMNQNGYPLAAAMSKDIFANDRKEYEKRVEWFTVNKTAPNKGWNSSITDLARLVDTNAQTGKMADKPNVQLMEMGRDQAHAGDDMEIFTNTARMMNAQGTKVDPVTGMISTAPDAVGPYEFLGDRILAAADQFCRFMLGYDTPWIPAPYDMGPNGEVRGIYPRIADNYRGRIRGFDFWDPYFYYACRKGVDVAAKAPYYDKAFAKRIVASPTDWIFIPGNVSGEGARVPATEQEPAAIEVARRSTLFDENARVVREGESEFVRITPSAEGARIAILSADMDKKKIGLRVRTNGVAEIAMSGLAEPWLIPDTQGQWRNITYDLGAFERFRDIVYFSVKGAPGVTVDIDRLVRVDADKLDVPAFRSAAKDIKLVAYVGAPVELDFAPAGSGEVGSTDKPAGAVLDAKTGAFSWKPVEADDVAFVVTLSDGEALGASKVGIRVAPSRKAAVDEVAAAFNPQTEYVAATAEEFQARLSLVKGAIPSASDKEFVALLRQLEQAAGALEPLTPQLPDGSMDFPKLVRSSNIGESIALLVDGNDDTFPVYFLAKDLNYIFDFGPGFEISVTAFAIEGRLNFENRAQDTALFGSNDGKTWVQLTPAIKDPPTELTRVEVEPEHRDNKFRFLKSEKTSRASAPLFEPSELRIFGKRLETK
ncbi:MAG: hypothetical protein WCO94_10035 [Verrucomicrobiota bacterium]